MRIIRQYFQAKQIGDTAATLRQGAGVDMRIAIVDESDGAGFEIESISLRTVG